MPVYYNPFSGNPEVHAKRPHWYYENFGGVVDTIADLKITSSRHHMTNLNYEEFGTSIYETPPGTRIGDIFYVKHTERPGYYYMIFVDGSIEQYGGLKNSYNCSIHYSDYDPYNDVPEAEALEACRVSPIVVEDKSPTKGQYYCGHTQRISEYDDHERYVEIIGGNPQVMGGSKAVVTLNNIVISTAPNKTSYITGEYFSSSGMVVKAVYSDGTEKTIASYTVSPTGALSTSNTSMTITFTENGVTKTVTQPISVRNKTAEEILAEEDAAQPTPNRREIISKGIGEWECPKSGMYRIQMIGGGGYGTMAASAYKWVVPFGSMPNQKGYNFALPGAGGGGGGHGEATIRCKYKDIHSYVVGYSSSHLLSTNTLFSKTPNVDVRQSAHCLGAGTGGNAGQWTQSSDGNTFYAANGGGGGGFNEDVSGVTFYQQSRGDLNESAGMAGGFMSNANTSLRAYYAQTITASSPLTNPTRTICSGNSGTGGAGSLGGEGAMSDGAGQGGGSGFGKGGDGGEAGTQTGPGNPGTYWYACPGNHASGYIVIDWVSD